VKACAPAVTAASTGGYCRHWRRRERGGRDADTLWHRAPAHVWCACLHLQAAWLHVQGTCTYAQVQPQVQSIVCIEVALLSCKGKNVECYMY
jgi:hypothetical protein